jgi:hypothetical protein
MYVERIRRLQVKMHVERMHCLQGKMYVERMRRLQGEMYTERMRHLQGKMYVAMMRRLHRKTRLSISMLLIAPLVSNFKFFVRIKMWFHNPRRGETVKCSDTRQMYCQSVRLFLCSINSLHFLTPLRTSPISELYIYTHTHVLFKYYIYRRTAVSTGNTFQDLPRLRETADNTERYI